MLANRPDHLRTAAGLPAWTRVVVFQGRIGPNLGLEAAAEAILQVPDARWCSSASGAAWSLPTPATSDPRYAGRHVTLQRQARRRGRRVGRIGRRLPDPAAADLDEPAADDTEQVLGGGRGRDADRRRRPASTSMAELVSEHDLGVVAASPSPADLAAAMRAALDRVTGPTAPRGGGGSRRWRRSGSAGRRPRQPIGRWFARSGTRAGCATVGRRLDLPVDVAVAPPPRIEPDPVAAQLVDEPLARRIGRAARSVADRGVETRPAVGQRGPRRRLRRSRWRVGRRARRFAARASAVRPASSVDRPAKTTAAVSRSVVPASSSRPSRRSPAIRAAPRSRARNEAKNCARCSAPNGRG